MSVDIVNLSWFDLGVLEGSFHGQQCPRAIYPGRRHVMRIATAAVTGNFSQNRCTSGFSVLQFFQNKNSRALGNNEPIAIAIKWSTAGAGVMVECRR